MIDIAKNDNQIREHIELVKQHHLHLETGLMLGWLQRLKVLESAVYYHKSIPVGYACVIDLTPNVWNVLGPTYMCYIKKEHRRKGYGTKLAKTLNSSRYHVIPWDNRSYSFYQSLGLNRRQPEK